MKLNRYIMGSKQGPLTGSVNRNNPFKAREFFGPNPLPGDRLQSARLLSVFIVVAPPPIVMSSSIFHAPSPPPPQFWYHRASSPPL